MCSVLIFCIASGDRLNVESFGGIKLPTKLKWIPFFLITFENETSKMISTWRPSALWSVFTLVLLEIVEWMAKGILPP